MSTENRRLNERNIFNTSVHPNRLCPINGQPVGVHDQNGEKHSKDQNEYLLDKKGAGKVPTILGPKYSSGWRGKPPHMLAPDIPVWYRFLKEWSPHFISLYYDCLLGGPSLSPEEEKEPLKKMWRALICKRADAIAELEEEVWLIEVSDHPEMRAVGQLITYEALWLQDPKINKPARKVLVANSIDPDITTGLLRMGVILHLV